MTSVERAAELGAEHGIRAAEEFLNQPRWHSLDGFDRWKYQEGWPQPDLSNLDFLKVARAAQYEGYDVAVHIDESYRTTFTSAVEATIRQHCEEVTP